MAQNIQYLYEYENGKPIRNLGFMKIDTQRDKTILFIQGKQLDMVTGIQLQNKDGRKYMATWQAEEVAVVQPMPEQPQPMPEQPQSVPVQSQLTEVEEEAEEVSKYISPSTTRCEKIQRQDLSRLPRREWRIANNSFLLHGFYNSHHLLYIEEDDKVWIGVPGIFHEKEKVAAKSFGFPEFRRMTDMELELSDEEQNSYEDFGYWCRQVAIS